MNTKLIVVISQHVEMSDLLANELNPILEKEYSNRYSLTIAGSEEEYEEITNHKGAFIVVVNYNKRIFASTSFLDHIIALSDKTEILLVDVEGEFPLEESPYKSNIYYFPGLLKLEKISQEVRNILNRDIERILSVVSDRDLDVGDSISSILRGLVGFAPGGALLAEVVGVVIPNQRMARFERFLRILAAKLVVLEEEQIRAKIITPSFIDLLEEGALQAVRAISEERLEHIAALLKNGLTEDDVELLGYKTLLVILGQLNDAEVLTLHSYGLDTNPSLRDEFWKKHQIILSAPPAYLGSAQSDVDKNTVHRTYKDTLVRLRLLNPVFKKPKKGELPDFDEDTGMIASKRHKVTPLGRLLLRYIDAIDEES